MIDLVGGAVLVAKLLNDFHHQDFRNLRIFQMITKCSTVLSCIKTHKEFRE